MGVSADRIISLLQACDEIIKANNQITLLMRAVMDDSERLKNEYNTNTENGDNILELIYSIYSSARSAAHIRIDNELLQNLFYEKARFEVNLKKNNSAKLYMKYVRDEVIIPKKQTNPRPKKDSLSRLSLSQKLEQDMEETRRWTEKYGEDYWDLDDGEREKRIRERDELESENANG